MKKIVIICAIFIILIVGLFGCAHKSNVGKNYNRALININNEWYDFSITSYEFKSNGPDRYMDRLYIRVVTTDGLIFESSAHNIVLYYTVRDVPLV